MSVTGAITKMVCSGPFSYALGALTGLVALYMIHKAREEQKLHQTLQEIEAMIKALEVRAQKGELPTQQQTA